MTAEKPQHKRKKPTGRGGYRPPKAHKPDRRSSTWRQIGAWKSELAAEIGEPTARQAALIEAAAKQRWLLGEIDNFLIATGSAFNRRERRLHDLTKEREQVLATLLRILDRLAPPENKADPLAQWLQQQRAEGGEDQ